MVRLQQSIAQINPFKNDSYLIGPCAKKKKKLFRSNKKWKYEYRMSSAGIK